MVALHINHPLDTVWTIGLVSQDRCSLGFTCGHAKHRLLKARNEFPSTQSKLEWFTFHRGVKDCPIGKPAGIVDSHEISRLCLGHKELLGRARKEHTHGMGRWKVRWSHHGPSKACRHDT